MFFFLKKNFYIYLYIFFLFLTFNFIQFSTNKTLAKNFVVSKIEVEERYNLNFNKSNILDRGFRMAFNDLSRMILKRNDYKKIKDTSIEDIKKLIENFSILDEKFINKNYKNIMEVQFNKKKIIKFFNSRNIIPSLPKNIDVFFLPILIDLKSNTLNYLSGNIFAENWSNYKENYFQINYILPNEDVEDYSNLKKNLKNIENYNFNEILKKYNSENYIVMIIFKNNEKLKMFSKVKFDDKFFLINENYKETKNQNDSNLSKLILKIKNKYEDNWKSVNKMSPSASVTFRLSLKSKKIEKSLYVENVLSNLDFVNDFTIERFNNLETIYKINYGSNPKRFLKDMLSFGIAIDTSSTNWKIK